MCACMYTSASSIPVYRDIIYIYIYIDPRTWKNMRLSGESLPLQVILGGLPQSLDDDQPSSSHDAGFQSVQT